MPYPIQRLLKEHGLDPKSLKAKFTVDNIKPNSEVEKLVFSIRDTVREGIERNRRDYRLYKAMDWAMDTPFYQVCYTQLRGLLSNKPDDKKVMETVNSWGLSHLLPVKMENGRECRNPDGSVARVANIPFLTHVFVPICMAYHTIRLAKLFNDRDNIPWYKYEPVQYTQENRMRCEIITQMVQKQTAWFDYRSDERQSISQMLTYGYCINFPREAWFCDKQEDESGKVIINREGMRWNMPHPSRTYYDMYHRLSTLNSNSGCEYAGYWSLERYKDIHGNKLYWNKDKIHIGAHSWFDLGRSDFLQQVYPCNMSFPSANGEGAGGVGALDRENDAARFYNEGTYNSATLKSEHFQRLIPKEHGLGSYEYPIWMRFVFASDNAVLWAEPLAFDRLPTYCYDADFNKSRFRSLVLETMPFQDQIGNILTQWGLAVRENLRNPVFYDKEKLSANAIQALENYGNKTYNGREYIGFNSTENLRFKTDQREAFFTPQLTHHNTSELAQLLAGMLDTLDRVLQLSPQEIGQAASHEQTAEESRIIDRNMSTRVSFTGGFVDDAIYCRKVVMYDANMAYADNEIIVGISSSFAATDEEFKKLADKLGLTILDDSTYDPSNPDTLRTVKTNKSALALETFASTRDATTRIDTPAIADAMSKIFIAISNNPMLIQSIGSVQLVELLNQIIVASGMPKEFRLKGKPIDPNQGQEEQAAQAADMMKGFAEQVKKAIGQSQEETLKAAAEQTQAIVGEAVQATTQGLIEQVQPMVQGVQQANQVNQVQQAQIDKLAQALAQLNQMMQETARTMTANQMPPPLPMMPPGMGPNPMQPMTPAPPVGVPA